MSRSSFLSNSESFSQRFYEQNWASRHKKKVFICRAGFMVFVTTFTVFNAFTAFAIQPNSVSCIYDGIFELTAPINEYFRQEKATRDSILIFSSFLIDVLLIWFCIRYAIWGKSSRQIIFFLLFYGTRAVVQSIFLMRKPEGYCWEYPGFPSITVSYQPTSDFFYSGHVGVVLFCGLENKYLGDTYMMWVAFSVCFLESLVMIFLRGHYSIDLISGLVFSHYFWIVSEWIADKIDKPLKLGIYM